MPVFTWVNPGQRVIVRDWSSWKPDPAQQPTPDHPIGPDCAFYLLSEGQHSPQLSWKICLAEPSCHSLRLFLVILGPRRELVKTSAHALSPTSSIVLGPSLHTWSPKPGREERLQMQHSLWHIPASWALQVLCLPLRLESFSLKSNHQHCPYLSRPSSSTDSFRKHSLTPLWN